MWGWGGIGQVGTSLWNLPVHSSKIIRQLCVVFMRGHCPTLFPTLPFSSATIESLDDNNAWMLSTNGLMLVPHVLIYPFPTDYCPIYLCAQRLGSVQILESVGRLSTESKHILLW